MLDSWRKRAPLWFARNETSAHRPRRQGGRNATRLLVEQLEDRTLLSAGVLDLSFNGTGMVTSDIAGRYDIAYSMAIDSHGKIVVVGIADTNRPEFALARFNPDGGVDTSLGGDGKVTTAIGTSHDYARSVALDGAGRLVVAGFFVNGSNNYDIALTRYDTFGNLDLTFDEDGIVTSAIGSRDDVANSVVIDGNGKIIVAGYSATGTDRSSYDFALARYYADGSLDTTFGSDGKLTTDFGSAEDSAAKVTIDSHGRIVVAGYSFTNGGYRFALARYTSDGKLDTAPATGLGPLDPMTGLRAGKVTAAIGSYDDEAVGMAIDGNGKIVIAGYSRNGNGTYDFALVRYNEDGSLDATFNGDGILTTDFGSASDVATSMAIDPNGKIVVAGYSTIGNNFDFALARYTVDGNLDPTFDGDGRLTTTIGSLGSIANDVAIDGNGNIVVAGYTNFRGSNADFALVRYEGDGPPNHAPTANAGGPYTVVEGDTVILTATGADPDSGDTIAFAWDLDNNGTFESSGQAVTFSAVALHGPSTQTVNLRVSDNHGKYTDVAVDIAVTLPVPPTQINLDPLVLQAEAGQFTFDGQTQRYTLSGTILIGLKPGAGQTFEPLVRFVGTASYDSATIQLTGAVYAEIGTTRAELFDGDWTIGVGQSTSNALEATPGSPTFTLAGLSVTISALTLTAEGIKLQGAISLPTTASGSAAPFSFAANGSLSLTVDGDHSILISDSGISVSGAELQVPDVSLQYQGVIFNATGLTATFDGGDDHDRLILHGLATLSSPFGSLDVNFTDSNSITIEDGHAAFVGTISLHDVSIGLWELKNACIHMDTTQGILESEAILHVPLVPVGFDLHVQLGFLHGQLNSLEVGAQNFDHGGLPIQGTPIYLQSISGAIEHLANSDSDPISFSGHLVLTAGPVVSIPLPSWLGGPVSGAVMKLDIHGGFTAAQVTGQAVVTVAGGLAEANGQFVLDWPTGTFTEIGDLSMLDGLITGNSSFVGDSSGNIDLFGTASVSLPAVSVLGFNVSSLHLASGQVLFQYRHDNDYTNDFVLASGTINYLFGSTSAGFKVDFAGNFSAINLAASTALIQATLSQNSTPTYQVANDADLQSFLFAVNGLTSPAAPATITVNVGGGHFSDVAAHPPSGVTLILIGQQGSTTIEGHSPALTVSSGTVIVDSVTLITATDSPTVLVMGGTLILRNDTIQESTGATNAAVTLTGGTLDLGTSDSPGNNVVSVSGRGELVHNSTTNSIDAFGNSFEADGAVVDGPSLSFTSVLSSGSPSIFGQAVSIAARVRPNTVPVSGIPSGNVHFYDTTTGLDLGSVALSAGTATLNTLELALGSHIILATYDGDDQFAPSLDWVTQQVNVPPNRVPALTLAPYQLTETEYTFASVTTDPDVDDSQTFSLISAPAGAGIDADGTFHWVPGAGQLGGFDVTVRVTDAGGFYDQKTVHLITLGLVNNDLIVVGTAAADIIAFSVNASAAIKVHFNGVLVGTFAGAQRLMVFSLGGDDDVQVGGEIALPSRLFGGAGNDQLKGAAGNDLLDGGTGNDVLIGGLGDNTLIGDTGDNDIRSGGGNDTVTAGDGNNVLHIDGGNDVVTLGDGNNDIHVGRGNNTVVAGDGNNTIASAGGVDFITVGNGANDIHAGRGNNTISAGNGDNVIHSAGGIDVITAGEGNNTISSDGGADTIVVGSGKNVIRAGQGRNAIAAGNGNNDITSAGGDDTINVGGGSNLIRSGAGNDIIIVTGNGNNSIDAGAGNDTVLINGAGDNAVNAGAGGDLVRGGAGNDTINGGADNDILVGGDGNDLLVGGDGRDVLIGGLGADRLEGKAGDDVLIGGTTLYDGNLAALDILMMEWASVSSYNDRVAHLRGTLGGGQNSAAAIFLRGDDVAGGVGNQTVFDDNAVDTLTGNQNTDWFLANTVADNSVVKDAVTDVANGEQATDIDLNTL